MFPRGTHAQNDKVFVILVARKVEEVPANNLLDDLRGKGELFKGLEHGDRAAEEPTKGVHFKDADPVLLERNSPPGNGSHGDVRPVNQMGGHKVVKIPGFVNQNHRIGGGASASTLGQLLKTQLDKLDEEFGLLLQQSEASCMMGENVSL